MRIAARQNLGRFTQLDDQPFLGRLQCFEDTERLRVLFQKSRESGLEERFRGLLDSPSGPRQFIGSADQLLERFIGLVGHEKPAGLADLGPRAVASPDQALAPGLGLEDHLLNQIVQPGQLAGMGHARQRNDERGHGEQSGCELTLGKVTHRNTSSSWLTTFPHTGVLPLQQSIRRAGGFVDRRPAFFRNSTLSWYGESPFRK